MAIVAKIVLVLVTLGILVVSFIKVMTTQDAKPEVKAPVATPTLTPTPLPSPPAAFVIPMKKHVVQTFNNCGPASLSMLLSYNEIDVSQQVLGEMLRPWQNPQGINDDKNVFLSELAAHAQDYDLSVYHRRDGDMELLKRLISNNIPVLVRTYLHPGEDIGHFRIVRGYNDTTSQVIQDDSYEGKNLTYTYDVLMDMWKPFNFEYVVMFPKEKEGLVTSIIGTEIDENVAWSNAYSKATKDVSENPDDILAEFNLSISAFHLNKYTESIEAFENVESRLPARTLWYQIEPIEAYLRTNNHERVLTLTDRILRNNNLAFSELYILRAESFRLQGLLIEAGNEIAKAVQYNKNLPQAIEAQKNLEKNVPLFTSF